MFVPSNFTVEKDTVIDFKNCDIHLHDGSNMLYANIYKRHFKGHEELNNLDIYTEDLPVVFLDKLESLTEEKERLLV